MKFSLKIAVSALISIMYIFNLNSVLISCISLSLFMMLFALNKKHYNNTLKSLIDLLIVSLPFSFKPLVGDNFFSLFILIQLLIILTSIFKKRGSSTVIDKLLWGGLLISINILYIFTQINYLSFEFELLIKTNIFILTLYCLSNKSSITSKQLSDYLRLYCLMGLVAAVSVFIQYLFFKYLGITDIGNQAELGQIRKGFSGLFYDYSIMSVYLASNALIILHFFINKVRVVNKSIDIILFLVFIGASVLTSARSGIAAFILSFIFLLIKERQIKVLVYSLLFGGPLSLGAFYLLTINRGENINYDSGRLENYERAIEFFDKNPLLGSGVIGYNPITQYMLPHNFILDFLVNYGIVITIVLLSALAYYLYQSFKYVPILGYLLLILLLGAMFHASLINTHYIMIPLILFLLVNNTRRTQSLGE